MNIIMNIFMKKFIIKKLLLKHNYLKIIKLSKLVNKYNQNMRNKYYQLTKINKIFQISKQNRTNKEGLMFKRNYLKILSLLNNLSNLNDKVKEVVDES